MTTFATFTVILISGAAYAAPAQKGALDGTRYRVVSTVDGKTERDTLEFDGGKLHSVACDPYAFSPAAYRAWKTGDRTDFEATTLSKTEGSILWKGNIQEGRITGNAVWKKKDQKDINFPFEGQVDRAKEAAARAYADIEKTLGFVPSFMRQVSPHALPGAWEEMKSLQMNPKTALSGRVKELIGLAVAAQVPCAYCTAAHTELSKLNGATDEERAEAIAMSALARHWSTYLNGIAMNEDLWDKEVAKMLDFAKKLQPTPEMDVTDAETARADMTRALGFTPAFINQFPEVALAGAWREMRDLEFSETTALSGKEKVLVGLAVASQIPCKYCVKADTAFAKLMGATDQEIGEAVTMAALVRHWSTLLNGHQTDKATFDRDVAKLIAKFKQMRPAS